MEIAVVGTGYVGLVAGTCFAESGNDVVCVDVDPQKIEMLRSGQTPIFEPGLKELLARNVAEERLSFTTDLASAVKQSLIVFIAVGTPQDEDGSADLSHVMNVARDIAQAMNGYKIVVTKSTVPVGTGEKLTELIASLTDHPFDVVSNPEFLKEGAAIEDFMKPDRVVIGTESPEAAEVMRELYDPFVRSGNPILVMDRRSAEMTKYVANAMLATKISFINEMANLCERLGADIAAVREGIRLDRRIGSHFIFPGCGYGGSCFPKDVQALIRTARDHGYEMRVLSAVEEVNRRQKAILLEKIDAHFTAGVQGKTIAIWGLSFKPNTDDMREATSCVVIAGLLARGAGVRVYDPVAMDEARRHFGDRITYCHTCYDALHQTSALVLVTEWNEFRRPNFMRMKELMAEPVVFDGRNVYNPKRMRRIGFVYYGIGTL